MTDKTHGDYFKFKHYFNSTTNNSDDVVEMSFHRDLLFEVVQKFKDFMLAVGYSSELVNRIQYIDDRDIAAYFQKQNEWLCEDGAAYDEIFIAERKKDVEEVYEKEESTPASPPLAALFGGIDVEGAKQDIEQSSFDEETKKKQIDAIEAQADKFNAQPLTTDIVTEEDAKRALDALALGNYSESLKTKIKNNIYEKFGDLND